MENILEVKKLRKEYKEFILKDISFKLPRGYIMGFIGPNGAGKSTTIKSLMNLLNIDGGDIKIFGLDYKNNEEEIKNRIGYVGEEQHFYLDMTVKWTGNFIAQYYNDWDNNKFDNLLKRFNVSKSKKIKELSKGMRVKLSLALALAHNPELLILDEPTSGLDPVIRREILDILMEVIEDENKSVLLSSHITEDIEKIADYITYIIDGKIVLSDAKENIVSNWKKVKIKSDLINKDIKRYLVGIEENFFGVSAITSNYSMLKGQLKRHGGSNGIKVENASLDDILVSFVKEEK